MSIAITFGDCAENNIGMQKITSKKEVCGYSIEELEYYAKKFKGELIRLDNLIEEEVEEAGILVIRDGIKKVFDIDPDELYKEQKALNFDTKAKMKGRVVNKKARYNLCFADFNQEPDYNIGKGRVYEFKKLPLLNHIRNHFTKFGERAEGLVAESNYYYNPKECYIGFHGDTERKIVICFRVGEEMPLIYQWYKNTKAIGQRKIINIKGGDIYIMSSKAVGFDWRRKTLPTLRHAAGIKMLQENN